MNFFSKSSLLFVLLFIGGNLFAQDVVSQESTENIDSAMDRCLSSARLFFNLEKESFDQNSLNVEDFARRFCTFWQATEPPDPRSVAVPDSTTNAKGNIAIGKGATANMGSVTVKDSSVKGTVTTKAQVKQSLNTAVGEGATANMGSVTVKDSSVKGTVTNEAKVRQSTNTAIGKEATANMGSISVNDSSVKGTVTNESKVNQSTNKAIGKGATSNMGSITIK